MANEISVSLSLTVSKGELYSNKQSTCTPTLNGNNRVGAALTLPSGGSAVALDLSSLATPGYMWAKNLDPVENIMIGIEVASVFYPSDLLKPGESMIKRIYPGAQPYAAIEYGGTGTGDDTTAVLDYEIFSD